MASMKNNPQTMFSHGEKKENSRTHSGWVFLRAMVAFLLLGILLALLYWWGYESYPDTAEWVNPGDHTSFVYKGDTYVYVGEIGKGGLTKSKYPIDEIVGQIKGTDEPETTESITTELVTTQETEIEWYDPEGTVGETETQPETVIPPKGSHLFSDKKHSYVLYSVKKQEGYLILLEEDGKHYLYELADPADTETEK